MTKRIDALEKQIHQLREELREAKLESKIPKDPITRLYWKLGREFANERRARGLTQENVIEKLGMTRTSLVNLEQGRQRSPIHIWVDLFELLDMNFGTVLALVTNSDE